MEDFKQMNFEIFINGHPKGQPRARAYARKMGAKFVARMYDSDTADGWKAQVRANVLAQANELGLQPIEGPFEVVMLFQFERPQSHFLSSGALGKGRVREHLQKPDADNLAKLVLDVITRLQRCWKDDDQVVRLVVEKRWAPAFKLPGCHLGVKSL
jgi:Holliday junction resolvase RusA-like endonuclease